MLIHNHCFFEAALRNRREYARIWAQWPQESLHIPAAPLYSHACWTVLRTRLCFVKFLFRPSYSMAVFLSLILHRCGPRSPTDRTGRLFAAPEWFVGASICWLIIYCNCGNSAPRLFWGWGLAGRWLEGNADGILRDRQGRTLGQAHYFTKRANYRPMLTDNQINRANDII